MFYTCQNAKKRPFGSLWKTIKHSFSWCGMWLRRVPTAYQVSNLANTISLSLHNQNMPLWASKNSIFDKIGYQKPIKHSFWRSGMWPRRVPTTHQVSNLVHTISPSLYNQNMPLKPPNIKIVNLRKFEKCLFCLWKRPINRFSYSRTMGVVRPGPYYVIIYPYIRST